MLHLHLFDTFQFIAVRVAAPSQPFVLIGLYRSPSLSDTNFIPLLKTHILPIVSANNHVLIVGDFNSSITTYLPYLGSTQFVGKSTHSGGSTLDHVYWTGQSDCLVTDVISCPWSDHNIVTITLHTQKHCFFICVRC